MLHLVSFASQNRLEDQPTAPMGPAPVGHIEKWNVGDPAVRQYLLSVFPICLHIHWNQSKGCGNGRKEETPHHLLLVKLLSFRSDSAQQSGDCLLSHCVPREQHINLVLPVAIIQSLLCFERGNAFKTPFFVWYPLLDSVAPGHKVLLPPFFSFLPLGPGLSCLCSDSIED